MSDFLIFGLAFVAYVMLAVNVVLSFWGRAPRLLSVAAALTAAVHVALVWGWRFGGALAAATEKGLTGFIIFHVALAVMIAASVAPRRAARWLTWVALPIVTAGAVGATFKYEVVGGYRLPLLVVFGTTVILAAMGWRRQRALCG